MNNTALTYKTLQAKDPTRSISLRNKFSSDMKRRFVSLRRAILKAVIDEDVFDLKNETTRLKLLEEVTTPGKKAWEYRSDPDKVKSFRRWLRDQERKGILELVRDPITGELVPWTNQYIETAYQRGILKGRADLRAEGLTDLPPTESGIGISSAFNQPIHVERIQPIFTRVFSDLEGVTEVMDRQMSRILSLGMAEGKSPYEIGRLLADRVNKIGITRGTLIARTEVIRTHNLAAINEFERIGIIIGEEILVQWWTALDERVRSSHANKHGKIYKKEKAQRMLGEPNCRCALLPIIPSVHKKEKKGAKKEGIRGRKKIREMKKLFI